MKFEGKIWQGDVKAHVSIEGAAIVIRGVRLVHGIKERTRNGAKLYTRREFLFLRVTGLENDIFLSRKDAGVFLRMFLRQRAYIFCILVVKYHIQHAKIPSVLMNLCEKAYDTVLTRDIDPLLINSPG